MTLWWEIVLQNAIVYYRKAIDILKTIMQQSCSSRCCTLTNVDYYHASPELKKKRLLQSLNSLLLSWQSLSQQGFLRNTKSFKVPKLPAWPKIGPDVNVWGQQRSTIHLNLQQTRQSIVAIQPITHLAQRLWLLSTKPTTIRQLPVLPLTHLCCKIPQNVTGVSAVTLLFKTHSLLIVCFESHRPFRQQTNPQKNKLPRAPLRRDARVLCRGGKKQRRSVDISHYYSDHRAPRRENKTKVTLFQREGGRRGGEEESASSRDEWKTESSLSSHSVW